MTANVNSVSSSTGSNGKGELNWPTVALIIASGAGNFLTTQHGNTTISAEQQEVYRQVRDLHRELEDFKRWQRQAGDNQQQMMQNDSKLLVEVHRIAIRLERLKNLDQDRGAPQ